MVSTGRLAAGTNPFLYTKDNAFKLRGTPQLGDVNGDRRCDVTAGGRVSSGGTDAGITQPSRRLQ